VSEIPTAAFVAQRRDLMIDSIVCFIGRLWTLLVTTLLAVGHDFDDLFLFLLSLDYSESLFEPFCSQQWRHHALKGFESLDDGVFL
jgi:hypothetical protein